MRLQGFTKAGPANYSPMNLLCGTNGTEQRGGSKVVVIGCSKEFSNETPFLDSQVANSKIFTTDSVTP